MWNLKQHIKSSDILIHLQDILRSIQNSKCCLPCIFHHKPITCHLQTKQTAKLKLFFYHHNPSRKFLLLKAYSLHLCLHTTEWWCLLTVVTFDLALKEGHETSTSPLWQRNLVQRRQGVRPDTSHPAWRSLSTERGRKTAPKLEFLFRLCVEEKCLSPISLQGL